MKVSLIKARELTDDQVQTWSAMQRANPDLDSPFFRPELTLAVSRVRDDVEIAILEQDGVIAGFFPFQRSRWNNGNPVGGLLNDFHGIICPPEFECDFETVLAGCRLSTWSFHRQIASQAPLRKYAWEELSSPYMNVAEGFDAYYANRLNASSRLRNVFRQGRNLERDEESYRYEWHVANPETLNTLIHWKSEQYRRTRVPDVFSFPWTVELVKQLHQLQSPHLSTVLSALIVRDQPIALDFGIRSGQILHSWFPAFDRAYQKYSPGMVLLMKTARAAPEMGIQRIELGAGPAVYKESLMSGCSQVVRGSAARGALAGGLRKGWHRVKSWSKETPLRSLVRTAANWTRPLRGWLAFR